MKDKIKQKQQGSIIIYAVFLMVVLSAIVSLMAFLVFVSIKSSANSKRAVSAFYAAESGLEKSLYTIETSRDSRLLDDTISDIDGSNVTLNYLSSYTLEANNDETTSLSFDLPIGQSRQIDLFDPDSGATLFPNPPGNNGNVYIGWSYNAISCTDQPIEIGIKEFDQSTMADILSIPYTVSLPSGSDTTITITTSWASQIKIKALECDLDSVDVEVTDSYANPVSLPNYIVIRSTGVNGKSSVKLQANTIWKPPLSGLGEFVLFSEESITK